MEYHVYWLLKSSCFEFSREEKYGLFWAKKLMERWNLLITGKLLFWTLRRWEIRSFLSQKVDGKMIFADYWKDLVLIFSEMGNTVFFEPKSWWKGNISLVFLSFPWYSRAWEIWFSCSVSLIWFVFCQLIYIKSTYIYSASSYMYSVWSYIHSVILYMFSLILYVFSMIFHIFSHLLNTPKTFLEIRPKQTARWTIVLSGQKMNSSFWGQQEISRPRKPMKGLIWNVSRKNMHRF